MPYSNRDNEPWVAAEILRLAPERILDVGPGAGAYGHLMARTLPQARRDAIEIWEPYIRDFKLMEPAPHLHGIDVALYHNVTVADAREWNDWDYDLVFFGDVIEHMAESEAREVWTRVSSQARAALISLPIIHYPQGPYAGNPYEVHVEEDWNTERVLDAFPGITKHLELEICGTYLAEF